jgi:hypothetical protein
MEMIWMKHPQLPEDQLINQPVEARIGLQQSGWQVTDPPEPMLLAGFESPDEEAAVESRPQQTNKARDGEEK